MELSSKYNPSEIEQKWYNYWLENNFFHSEPDHREPYTIVIPPPNVTGILHMGHMLNNTIQDILVRYARLNDKNVCWVPGTDHASIATEAKVVGKLASEGIKKTDLTREEFLKHAWQWTDKHGGIILEQLKKLGCACDWDRTAFTMDEIRSKSVISVFCDLYEKQLIYRGIRMVNWDTKALTALSDEEVIYKEQQGKLYYLKYKIVGEDSYAIVATTRPETIMGDTAMCINPNNPKTAHLKGKKVIVPIVGREIPVIEDEYVDAEFGTGCLKVTPAHDINDYMLGNKYNLKVIDIFNDNGTINDNGGVYVGMDRFDCRCRIEQDLSAANLIEKIEDYTNKVGYSERTDVQIEPKLSMQWWLKMDDLAKPALDKVEDSTIKFYPEKLRNTYRHWMTNIKDWCISRQLWWGHQIPAYYLPNGGFVVAKSKDEAYQKALTMVDYSLSKEDLRQDEDCLDTWFSSWLWPISVFDGINNPNNKDIEYYYPTSDLVTAPDIIFFWVARMIMAGYEYRNKECFKNVYFTGIVRDKLGRKMSKQLGNSPDPIELIQKYGADGVRMGLLLTAPAGNDIPFDEALCETGRNFCNKIWNAFRLIQSWEIDDKNFDKDNIEVKPEILWFNQLLKNTIEEINDLLSKYRLSEAITRLYKLFWDDFCSWYLEIIKPQYGSPLSRDTYEITIYYMTTLLQILHPFMPFITEELWHSLRDIIKEKKSKVVDFSYISDKNSIMNTKLGVSIEECLSVDISNRSANINMVDVFDNTKMIITNIRNARTSKNISPKEPLMLRCGTTHITIFDDIIKKLANVSIEITDEKPSNAVSFIVGRLEYLLDVGDKIDVEEEIKKLEIELKYQEGFLMSVKNKLSNEKFVNNAKPEIVSNERNKQATAEAKIATLQLAIEQLQGKNK